MGFIGAVAMIRFFVLILVLIMAPFQANAMSSDESGQPYFVYNPTGNKLTAWRAALAAVKAGSGDARVIFMGTSTVSGYCSAPGSWALGHTLEYLFAEALTARYGVTASAQSWFGGKDDDGTGRNTADSRLVIGSSWSFGGTYSIGGPMFTSDNTTNSITFTPKNAAGTGLNADTFVIWHGKETGMGTCAYKIDSGSETNFSNAVSGTAVGTVTVSTTDAPHTLSIRSQAQGTAGGCNIIGVEARTAATKYVSVINSGIGGVLASNWDWSGPAKAFGMPQVMGVIKPNLLIIMMNNNDAIANTDDTAYKATMQKFITQVKTTNSPAGDVVLVSQIPYGAGAGTIGNNTAKLADLKALADTNSIMWINLASKYPTYVGLTAAGLSCGDDLHMNAAGYDAIGKILVDALGGAQ